MGILPNEDISVEDYVNSLTSEKFSYLYNNRRYSSDTLNISVKIPEFKVEGDYNLKDTLQNMGITTAFTDGADFSNMLNVPNKISKVRQKAFLQLDRNGTKAAAVTIITDVEASCVETPVEMEFLRVYLDRPFAYAIVDTQTGLPIFMGVVNSVESPELD
jgi:serpin B